MSHSLVTVLGGTNLDIIAVPAHRILPGDSAEGRVSFLPGGVGRNVAQALKETAPDNSLHVELITALGDDEWSRSVRKSTENTGVSLQHSLTFPGETCPVYSAVMDGDDLLAGVNDMALLKKLTPENLKSYREPLAKADLIVLDANLEQASLEWVAENFPKVPLFAETVSAVKCNRFVPILSQLYGIKPNKKEAEELTGRKIHSAEDALEAAARLQGRGIQNVIITLGKEGSVYYSQEESGIITPPFLENIKDVTGAGDYYLAGVIYSLLQGSTLKASAQWGTENACKKLKGEL
jgi:pseudouridine kinase